MVLIYWGVANYTRCQEVLVNLLFSRKVVCVDNLCS